MKKLIHEKQVLAAAKSNKIITINDNTIITPTALDTARLLGVQFEKITQAAAVNEEQKHPLDTFPVKTVAIAADHGGFSMKEELKGYLKDLGYIVHDLGPSSSDPCDYPDYAFEAARKVAEGKADRAVMIDSVGIGSAMAANKVKGVLAAKCNNSFEARSSREHNYANMLTLGSKIIGIEIAKEIVKIFLETPVGAERHQLRVQKILDFEG
jgi:ribose 5-phosphate isomerase B